MNVSVERNNMMRTEKVEDCINKQTMLHYNQIVENMTMDTTSYKCSCELEESTRSKSTLQLWVLCDDHHHLIEGMF